MPRGEWDRTKTKEQRAAEKKALKNGGGKARKAAAPATPAKKKYAKPQMKSEALKGESPKASAPSHIGAVSLNPRAFQDLQVLQHHFGALEGAGAGIAERHTSLLGDLAVEMSETLKDLAAIRQTLFSHYRTRGIPADLVAIDELQDMEEPEKTDGSEPVTLANEVIPKLGRGKKSKAIEAAPEQAAAPTPEPAAEAAPVQAPAPLLPKAEAPAAFTQAPAPFPPSNGAVS